MKLSINYADTINNLSGGVANGLISFQLLLGFSLASGQNPFPFVVSFFVVNIIFCLFNSGNVIIGSVPASFAVIIILITSELDNPIIPLIPLLLVSIFLFSISYYKKLDKIILKFPIPVVVGIAKGIGILIIIKNIPHLLGTTELFEEEFTLNQLGVLNWVLIAVALIIPVGSYLINRLNKKLPALLITTIITFVFCFFLNTKNTATLESYFTIPEFSLLTMLPNSFYEAYIHFRTGLLLIFYLTFDFVIAYAYIKNTEPSKVEKPTFYFKRLGIASFLTSFIGAPPSSISIINSTTNFESKATNWISIAIQLIIICLLFILPNITKQIPLFILSGIIIHIGIVLIRRAHNLDKNKTLVTKLISTAAALILLFKDLTTAVVICLILVLIIKKLNFEKYFR